VCKTWSETLNSVAADETNDFSFQILETGWNNIDAPSTIDEPDAPRPAARDEPLEFFPSRPKPLCPAVDSSLVLGTFEPEVLAARAFAADLSYASIDFAEELQPDGTFSLCTLSYSRFEVRTTRPDGTASESFGPFRASGRCQVTHLGLLSLPRDNKVAWEDQAQCLSIVLPELEFPPHGAAPSSEDEAAGVGERCTCFGHASPAGSEGEEEPSGEEY